ncbi:SGNH/GDSL hydrolase family protein [Arsenicicoccus dermatophilus]|uniref:SGNH/GDSL hydrolase family protein n=1 Tax=Arsenicicoccus dermatophilus TaxID=1076331 RepID=UPI00391704F2
MRHPQRTLRRVGAAAAALSALALATAAPAQAGHRDYVALGDSYSSGESLSPYHRGTDTAINQCHRSASAYPHGLARSVRATSLTFRACSGAVTDDLYTPDHNGNKVTVDALVPAQLSHVTRDTDLVTLTIGGNDVGFASVLGTCVYGDAGRSTRTDCSTDPALTAAVTARLDALAGRGTATTPHGLPITPLAKVIRDVRAKAPTAQILLGTYPRLVSRDLTGAECRVGGLTVVEDPSRTVPLYVSAVDAAWFDDTVTRLDRVILDAPRQAGVVGARAADVRPAYGAHALCSPTTTSWITPVKGTVSTATGAVTMDASSMHPTALGQDAYRIAFRDAVR